MNTSHQTPSPAVPDDAVTYTDRLDWAARLRRLALLRAERDGATIRLWYAAPFQDEVRRWVANHERCSPRLNVTMQRLPSGVLALAVVAAVGQSAADEELLIELCGID